MRYSIEFAALAVLAIATTPAGAVITCGRFGCSDWHNHVGRHRTVDRQRIITRHRLGRYRHRRVVLDANGNPAGLVVSHKTGARAHVSPRYAARFQGFINDLEAHGARIYFMGGYRRGQCSARHEHPCGKALDVCQLARDVVAHGQWWHGHHEPNCHLPGRRAMAIIAARHDLFSGGEWCNGDNGHFQVEMTAPACRNRQYVKLSEDR